MRCLGVLTIALGLLAAALPPIIQNVAYAQGSSLTFPETGKTVQGKFLDYWQSHGALPQQGYPISDEMQEVSQTDGKIYTVQYFERAVFELHPENAAPYDVLLSLLGDFFYQQKYPNGAPNQQVSSDNAVTFSQTGHSLGGRFRQYWEAHGGLAQQGYPISDEFQETSPVDGKTYTVQYFERAVFELHPENAAPYDVLLSLLGTFRYKARYASDPESLTAIDAAVALPNGKAFFFKRDQYIQYDMATNQADQGYPKPISAGWPDYPFDAVDAAAIIQPGYVDFFDDGQVARYNLQTGHLEPGYPKDLSTLFPGVANITYDAVLADQGTIYFFTGPSYQKYHIDTGVADKTSIAYGPYWPGLPSLWTDNINDAVNWGNGKAYFFKGYQVLQFDLAKGQADPGYPQPVSSQFKGVVFP